MKKKKIKVTLDEVLDAVNRGFTSVERRMDGMVTKEEFNAFRDETRSNFHAVDKRFNQLDMAIDAVKDDLAVTEEVNVSDLQHRMIIAEKDIRYLKSKHG